jgi:general secretion pathway protein E
MVAAALKATMAQRLVRRLCPDCAQPASDTAMQAARWRKLTTRLPTLLDQAPTPRWLAPIGCPRCQQTGFRGRVGIYELVELSAEMQHSIAGAAPLAEVQRLADAAGRRSLVEDGLVRAAQGVTTLEEVLRASSGTVQE